MKILNLPAPEVVKNRKEIYCCESLLHYCSVERVNNELLSQRVRDVTSHVCPFPAVMQSQQLEVFFFFFFFLVFLPYVRRNS